MAQAILKGYNDLDLNGDENSPFSIVTPTPFQHNSTKVKRWWNKSYEKVIYEDCALINYKSAYIVVVCSHTVELLVTENSDYQLEFKVGFKNPGDGNVRRILVVPKIELYNPVNYEDLYYEYGIRSFIKTVKGNGSGISVFGDASLDLNFANNKSLVDSITGRNLVTHTRASNATYVDSNGLIKNAVTNLLGYSEDSSQWTTSSSTVSNTTVEAPDGSLTAISFEEDLVTAAHIARRVGFSAVAASTQYTMSAYAKAGVRDYITLWANGTVHDISVKQTFDVANGTLGDSSAVDDASITDVGNGWYRCSMTFTSGAAPTGNHDWRLLTNANESTTNNQPGISGVAVYIWGAQLEESSTVGEYVKTTSTINSAPRFDHDPVTGESLGLLVEEARTNSLVRSAFDAGGTTQGAVKTLTTEINPAGEAETRRLQATATNNPHRINYSATSANIITVSAFVKKDTHRYVNIGFGGFTSSFSALFDIEPNLTSDRLLGQGVIGENSTNISAGYQDYPNGWVRIWAVGTTTGTNGLTVQLARDATVFSLTQWVADGTEAIYIWGGQFEDNASFPTSLIHTDGSAVTRAADVAEITGNDFGTFNLLQHSEHLHEPFVAPNGWGASAGLTRTPNAAIAPNGTKTATRLTQPGGASSNQFFQRVITLPVGTYTLSVYAKAVSGSVDFALNAWNSTDSAQTGPVITATTEWQRFTHTFTTTVADTFIYIFQGVAGTVAGDIDFWGAQLEESSTVTPYVKSDVTWTSRASNATYYDYTGTLRKSSYNRFTYSEDLSNASWSKLDVNNLSQVVGPNGETAWSMDLPFKTDDANVQENLGTVKAFADGQPCTSSFYIRSQAGYGTQSLKAKMGRAQAFGSGVFSITEDWQRISVVDDGDSIGNTKRHFGLQATEGDVFIEATGFQVEAGPYAGDYVKTEGSAASSARDAAFLPDGNGNFVSAGELLLEEAGTNLFDYSEDFSKWVYKFTNVTLNSALAPDGTNTATKFIPTSTNGKHHRYKNVSLTAGNKYTFTAYAKAGEYDQMQLLGGLGGYGVSVTASFNLTSGTATVTTSGTNTSADITFVGNGWYRCRLTAEATISAAPQHQIYVLDENGAETFSGNSVDGLFIWGAQLEEASFATSYIPTSGAAATRAADVSSSSANTFGNSFYKQSEGTVFALAERPDSSRLNTDAVSITDGTGNNRLELRTSNGAGNAQARMQINASGVNTFVVSLDSNTAYKKLALAYATNDAQAAANGLASGTDTTVSIPVVSQLYLGNDVFSITYRPGHIKRVAYWPTRLSSTTLQTITN